MVEGMKYKVTEELTETERMAELDLTMKPISDSWTPPQHATLQLVHCGTYRTHYLVVCLCYSIGQTIRETR